LYKVNAQELAASIAVSRKRQIFAISATHQLLPGLFAANIEVQNDPQLPSKAANVDQNDSGKILHEG